jgi:hypothetical protein
MAWPALPVPLLFALLIGVGTVSSMANGARASLVRTAVAPEAYVPARSLLRIVAQSAQIVGNAAGGALLLVLTPNGALLVNALSFVASATTIRLFVADHPNPGEPSNAALLRDSLHGARAIFGRPELRRLLLVGWLAPMFAVAPEAVAAPYVSGHHGSASLVGWWLVALPVGLIAGDVAGVRLLTTEGQRRAMAPAAVASFLPYLVFAFDPPVAGGLALLAVAGFLGFYSLGLDARVRDEATPRLFSRAMTLNSAFLMTLQGAGFALAGAIAQAVGPATAIAVAGTCGACATAALLRRELADTGGRNLVRGCEAGSNDVDPRHAASNRSSKRAPRVPGA